MKGTIEVGGRVAERKIKRLSVVYSDGTVEHRATTSDISHTGIFIRTRKTFRPGTHLRIVLELDDSRTVTLTGVVTRLVKLGTTVFKDGIGVKLTSHPQEYKELVEKLLKQ